MQRRCHTTRRLIMRPLQLKDYLAWFDAWGKGLPAQNEWDVAPRSPRKITREAFKKLLRRHRQLASKDQCYIYGVFLKKEQILIGHIDISLYARDVNQFGNLGYRIFNRY